MNYQNLETHSFFVPRGHLNQTPLVASTDESPSLQLTEARSPHLISYLNVLTESHHITHKQAISKSGIPISLASFLIGLIACHTYVGVSLVATTNRVLNMMILTSSVTLNTFVNTYFMQNNIYNFVEEFNQKIFGSSVLKTACEDLLELMPSQQSRLVRTSKFLLWTAGCLLLTSAAVYPFYSVDVNHSIDGNKIIPIFVGVAFGGLLYQPVNEMVSRVVEQLKYYGYRSLNFLLKPLQIELEPDPLPFPITQPKNSPQFHDALSEIHPLQTLFSGLKEAHAFTIEQSRQYYLGLLQSGRNVHDQSGVDPILENLYQQLHGTTLPDYQRSFDLLHAYNTLTVKGEERVRYPSHTPWWQFLTGVLHNPLAWVSLLGFVNQAIIAAGSTWLGILYSSPLLLLSGYTVAQPLIIKILDYVKVLFDTFVKVWNGERIRLEAETWQQCLARLLPMPLHMIQNPKKMFLIMSVASVMAFFSCFVAASLNAQLFGTMAIWPLVQFVTFYITILFNINPVDKVCGALFRFGHKAFGDAQVQNEIRLNEFADTQLRLVQDMDATKFFGVLHDAITLTETNSRAVTDRFVQTFFGHTDLFTFLKLDEETLSIGNRSNLDVLKYIVNKYDQAKVIAQAGAYDAISDEWDDAFEVGSAALA